MVSKHAVLCFDFDSEEALTKHKDVQKMDEAVVLSSSEYPKHAPPSLN